MGAIPARSVSADSKPSVDGATFVGGVIALLASKGRARGDDTRGTPMASMTVEATIPNVPKVTAFVNDLLEEHGCPLKAQTQIDIAIDEVFGNISMYAYTPKTGPATVCVDFEENPPAVIITFIDNGKSFNPLSAEEPDITLPAERRKIGGLGVFIVKKIMDDVIYEHEDGRNILRIRKVLA